MEEAARKRNWSWLAWIAAVLGSFLSGQQIDHFRPSSAPAPEYQYDLEMKFDRFASRLESRMDAKEERDERRYNSLRDTIDQIYTRLDRRRLESVHNLNGEFKSNKGG